MAVELIPAILGAAAVIGREFDLQLLEHVAETSAGALLDLLESPALAGIVELEVKVIAVQLPEGRK